ncbi:MAG: hypothetical protein ACRCYZ_00835 [Alphaproteobacteria bacterium]
MSKLQAALSQVKGPNISTRELQQQQYKPSQVQAVQHKQTDYSGQLLSLAQGGSQLYAAYDKQREETGIKRKNAIMLQNLKPEEMRKLRESGELLYQDDSYAMRALDRALGRQEAFAAEGVIQQRIAEGFYKSRSEMEEDRANILKERMGSMSEAYGIDQQNRAYFDEGYASDMTDRSFAIYGAMDKKVDEYNRNNAVLAVDNEVTELVKSGNGQHIVQVLQTRLRDGVIRNEKDFESHLQKALKEVAASPQSVDLLNTMADTELTLFGEKTTLRQRLGDETIKTMTNQAAQATLANNWESQKYVMEKLSFLTAPDFQNDGVNKGLDAIRELEDFANQTQGPQATALRQQIQSAKMNFDRMHREYNEKQKQAINTEQQQKVRLSVLDALVNGRETGDLNRSLKLSSLTEDASTGKYEAQDWNRYYDFKSDQIDATEGLSDDQKALQKLRLGVLLKDIPDSGFGAHYAETFQRVNGELAKYSSALDAGAELPDTPELNRMMEFYKASPELFSQTFGPDFPMANSIAISATMGVHPSMMIQGQKRLEQVRSQAPEQQQQLFKEFANWENNQGNNIYQHMSGTERDNLRALYLGMDGYANSTKMEIIDKHLKSQYEVITGGVVPKSFLMSNPQDPSSVSVGKQRLEDKIKARFPTGNVYMAFIGDRVKVWGSIGSAPMTYTKEMLMSDE